MTFGNNIVPRSVCDACLISGEVLAVEEAVAYIRGQIRWFRDK